MVTLPIVAAVLAAAVLHAVWNAIAHTSDNRLTGFALIGAVQTAAGGVLCAIVGPPDAKAWPYIAASAVAHGMYNMLLLKSYELGEFSHVYPLARGSAPAVVAVIALVALHQNLSPRLLAGIAAVSVGLVSIASLHSATVRQQLPALAAALGTGVMIAIYTVIDGLGVSRTTFLPYVGWMFLLSGPVVPAWAVLRRSGGGPPLTRKAVAGGIGGGAVSLIAYGLVLSAQRHGALAAVAAMREISIVFSGMIGAAFLHEPYGRRRSVAAVIVVIGVILISVS